MTVCQIKSACKEADCDCQQIGRIDDKMPHRCRDNQLLAIAISQAHMSDKWKLQSSTQMHVHANTNFGICVVTSFRCYQKRSLVSSWAAACLAVVTSSSAVTACTVSLAVCLRHAHASSKLLQKGKLYSAERQLDSAERQIGQR